MMLQLRSMIIKLSWVFIGKITQRIIVGNNYTIMRQPCSRFLGQASPSSLLNSTEVVASVKIALGQNT